MIIKIPMSISYFNFYYEAYHYNSDVTALSEVLMFC